MVKLHRCYSLTSFIFIFVAVVLLTLLYRQITLHWIESLTKTSHQTVAQTALNSISPEFFSYLASTVDFRKHTTRWPKLPTELAEKIQRITHDTTVVKIDIYNRNGLLVFSTHAGSIEDHQGCPPAPQPPFNGSISTQIVFQGLFDNLKRTAGQGKLMQTCIPIRSDPGAAITGVFAIHSDVSRQIEESNKVMLFILGWAALILAILYAILFFVMRHTENIIDAQQNNIRERTTSLEMLSRNLLKGEALQKKKIATDLHEGLAQTLSAIKINMESNELNKAIDANTQSLGAIVPVLQHAIHEVRTIATELHPSSLDDLGLLPTILWFCREFERRHPAINIQREISLAEANIPPLLKIDIYRIIESAFKNISKYSGTNQICLVLHLADDMIHLIIDDTPTRQPRAASIAQSDHDANPQFRFAEIKERTSLSGGVFSNTLDRLGWATLRASWACVT